MARNNYTWNKNEFSFDGERRISEYVREMMTPTDIKQSEVAYVIDRRISVFRNKLYLSKFTLEELTAIADMAGWKLQLTNGKKTLDILANDICDIGCRLRLKDFHEKREATNQETKVLNDAFDQADPEILQKAYQAYIAAHPEKFNNQ